eukprot:TRINITY_DN65249_c0_g1_i1.p1 TRINITY_DN65249_c0_g1~~TRINITY_DN65249_c0_g1_i1.p1  ORF type:complete len:246 (+),score=33.92 TRINITY_DN65249_c0_g1_i1:27-740(+)
MALDLEDKLLAGEAYPVSSDGRLASSLQEAWGLPERWETPERGPGWYKAVVDAELAALGRVAVVSTLLTGICAAALSSPIASIKSWPGDDNTFYGFVVLAGLGLVCHLGSATVVAHILWNLSRELVVDAHIDASGELPGFQVGFGAYRTLVVFSASRRLLCCQVSTQKVISWMNFVGIAAVFGAFCCKVLASIGNGVYLKSLMCAIFFIGWASRVPLVWHGLILRKSRTERQQHDNI